MKGKFLVTSVGDEGVSTEVEFSGSGSDGLAFYGITVKSSLVALRRFITENRLGGSSKKAIFAAALGSALYVDVEDDDEMNAVTLLACKLFDRAEKPIEEKPEPEEEDHSRIRLIRVIKPDEVDTTGDDDDV